MRRRKSPTGTTAAGPTWRRRGLALAAASLLAACGAPDRHGARVERFTVDGREQVAVIPADAPERGAPLLLFLHGRGSTPQANAHEALFDALEAQGRRAPVVVLADGGVSSYWHDRAARAWGRYVIDGVLPAALRRFHADRERVAIGGISMGGFGALDLARLHPGRFCAVGAHSPALFLRGGETAPGAFDDAADFARHDVVRVARGNPASFGRARIWLDIGRDDPFRPGFDALAGAVRAEVHRWPGGHSGAYWRAHWGSYARFYAKALADC